MDASLRDALLHAGLKPAHSNGEECANIAPERHIGCHLALALVQAITAIGIVYLKAVMVEAPVDAITFAFWRFVGATPLLLAISLRGDLPPLPFARDFAWFAILGTLLVGNQLFSNLGVQLAGALIATCMQPTSPVLSAALAVALGQERLPYIVITGTALSVAGAVIVAAGRGQGASIRGTVSVGFGCLVINSFCFAAYVTLMKEVVHKYSTAVVTGASQGLGLLVMLAVVLARLLLTPEPPSLWLPSSACGVLAYWVLAISTIGYLTVSWANRHLPASTVALYAVLQPAVGALLSVLILGDSLRKTDLGAVGIALGLVLVVRRPRERVGVPCAGPCIPIESNI